MGATMLVEPATITVDEAARLLGISRRHAYNAAGRGEIPAIRVGRRILIPRRRLLELLEGEASDPEVREKRGDRCP